MHNNASNLINNYQIKRKLKDRNKEKAFTTATKNTSQEYTRNTQKAKKRLKLSDCLYTNRENWIKKVSL